MTSKEFDLGKVGKRMPYTTPDGFFDKLEEDIWEKAKTDCLENVASSHTERKRKLRIWQRGTIAVAASIALVVALSIGFSSSGHVSANDVDQAFCQLSADDQAFLLSIYQEDLFVNE